MIDSPSSKILKISFCSQAFLVRNVGNKIAENALIKNRAKFSNDNISEILPNKTMLNFHAIIDLAINIKNILQSAEIVNFIPIRIFLYI